MGNMNEIELLFYNTFHKLREGEPEGLCAVCDLESQVQIGKYRADFVYCDCVIEIDGHEYHKTKQQRIHDYARDRYLMKEGYSVIRFAATEVFCNPERFVREAIEIGNELYGKGISNWIEAYDLGEERGRKEADFIG